MASKLDRLREMTTVVADTGDIEQIRAFAPVDCTTNPSLILKAAAMPQYGELVDEAIAWGRRQVGESPALIAEVTDRLAINFGSELARLVPGRVSTEVDADLSFDTAGSIAKAKKLIADYEARGVGRERILIKLASTWEGIRAAEALEREGINCNLTLLFGLVQAAAAAEAGATLVSPFVGRILDWHKKAEGRDFGPEEDPGVASVRRIYAYLKGHGYPTVVMGASFRNLGEIEALAGCDRLTISPQFLGELAEADGDLPRRLAPEGPHEAPPRLDTTEAAFRWQLNEDAMATEKLAEGIRLFARDLAALKELVAARIAEAAAA